MIKNKILTSLIKKFLEEEKIDEVSLRLDYEYKNNNPIFLNSSFSDECCSCCPCLKQSEDFE